MKIYGSELLFNNGRVYHAGDKPTASDVGAAPIDYVDNKIFEIERTLDAKAPIHTHPYKEATYVPDWSEIINKPSGFTPAYHLHEEHALVSDMEKKASIDYVNIAISEMSSILNALVHRVEALEAMSGGSTTVLCGAFLCGETLCGYNPKPENEEDVSPSEEREVFSSEFIKRFKTTGE